MTRRVWHLAYYMVHTGAPLIFPSVHLYPLVSGDRGELERVYRKAYHPEVSVVKPSGGVVPGPHIMIVPEYVGRGGGKPEDSMDVWGSVNVFDTYPAFGEVRRDPVNECRVFEFSEGRKDVDLQFVTEPSRVTVCLVRRTPPRLVSGTVQVVLPAGSTNLALGRPASQSSTVYASPASRAVDGNTGGDVADNSLSHTDYEQQPWWEVDLGGVEAISYIQVWNRTDCCEERLTSFYVFVSETAFASMDLVATLRQPGVASYYLPGQGGRPTTVSVKRRGRYIRIQLTESNYLTLAEVQVWSDPTPVGRGN